MVTSCNGGRRRFAGLLAIAAVVVMVCVVSVGATSAAPLTAPPYLNEIATVLRQRSPGTEGKIWWLRHGNVLPEPTASSPGWLLQTVNCWGKSSCSSPGKPPPGGVSFLQKMKEMVEFARKSVDFADLINPAAFSTGYPNGGYFNALVDGLKEGHKNHPKDVPVVRILIGVFPPTIPAPTIYLKTLVDAVGSWAKVQIGYMRTAPYSWNHAKVLDVDGREAIVGGMNYWAGDYLDTSHPTNDVSMWVKGPVAADVSRFMDVLWTWTCDRRFIPFNGVFVGTTAALPFLTCVKSIPIDPAPPDPHGVWIMVVGKLGHGIDVPGEKGKESEPIARPALSGNTCNTTQAKDDNKDVNNKRDYEYRNPGETALRTLIASAKSSIFISQQDLLSCLPKPWAATEAKFDERVFAALAEKINAGIPIKIVLSSYSTETGGYSNGWHLTDVAQVFMQMLQKNERLSEAVARQKLCRDVGLTTIRNDASAATWKDGKPFYNHAKVVAVDDEAFYIGSGNLYPSGLQELGFIVDDRQAAAHLKEAYLDPLWNNSRAAALIDPQDDKCGAFSAGVSEPPTVTPRSRTFVVRADTTKTFDVRYPSVLTSTSNAGHYCQADVVSGPGARYVTILSRRSQHGGIEGPRLKLLPAGTVCRVKVRNNATRRSRGTTARVKVTATTVQ